MCPRCKSRLWRVPKIAPVRLGRGLGVDEVLGAYRVGIRRLTRRYGVKKLRVFGSVRRGEATQQSDVDLLVTWNRSHTLLDRAALAVELSRLIGRRVDLVNEGSLHWAIAPQVESEAIPL